MHTGLAIDPVLLTVFSLLVAGAFLAGQSERLPIPSSLLFLGLGMLVGDDGLALIRFDDPELVQNIGTIALIVILFEGGLTTKPNDLRAGGLQGFVLSNLGVFITAGVVAAAVRALLGTDWETALLLGAIVSSTDAAAVFSLLRRAPLPRRLAAVLEVESGANDPFAVVLTLGLVAHIGHGSTTADWVAFGFRQLVGGLVLGAACGWVAVQVLRRVDFAPALVPVLAFGFGGLSYAVAAALDGSGFFAVYVSGLLVGALVPRHRRIIRGFLTSLANSAEIGLFLILGLLVFPSDLPAVAGRALAVTAVLLLVARPVAVAVCLTPFRMPAREQAVVAWAGLRGAVPIVLATFPYTAGLSAGDTIFDVVFFVVLISVLLQGSTVPLLVRRLGLDVDAPAWTPIAEAIPTEAPGVDLIEVSITPELVVVGRELREVPPPPGFLVTSILRSGDIVLPSGSTVIEPGDLLVIVGPRGDATVKTVTDWARGGPS